MTNGSNKAVYAGTFDPVTMGHLSVIEAASRLFDHLVVLLAVNPEKRTLFNTADRLSMLRSATKLLGNVSCDITEDYVVEYARAHGATHLVRGIRDVTDADHETTLANANAKLAPEIKTIFVTADPELSRVSSSHLKDMVREGECISGLCPPEVEACLVQRLTHHVDEVDEQEGESCPTSK